MAATVTGGVGRATDTVAAQDAKRGQEGGRDDPIAEAGQFELVALASPDEVEVMTPFAYSYTVANTGDEDATFWTYFTVDAWGESGVVEDRHGLTVPANAEVTVEINTAHSPYTGTLRYSLEAFEESFSVDAVTAYSALGEEWRSPNDVVITVEKIEFRDAYEYESYDGSTTEEPAGEGSQWAFVWIRAENAGKESRYLPSRFAVIANDRQFDRAYISKEEGAYESGDVEPGIERSGWVAYEIPAELSPEEVAVSHTDSDLTGDWAARWTVDADGDESEEETTTGTANGAASG